MKIKKFFHQAAAVVFWLFFSLYVLLLLFIFLLGSGAIVYVGWQYPLPGSCVIFESAEREAIAVCKKRHSLLQSGIKAINKGYYQEQISYNDRYSFVTVRSSQDDDLRLWCIIDDQDNNVYGFFESEAEFNEQLSKLGTEMTEPWQPAADEERIEGVQSFCYGERYVGIIVFEVPDGGLKGEGNWKNWYLIDSRRGVSYGPYTESEYLSAVESAGANDLCEWISTRKKPNEAEPNWRTGIQTVRYTLYLPFYMIFG